jgi:ADP-heptose:LPS heptosyltransferase
MKILLTNPDSIGDFILRQPMFNALAAAGHELLLVTRPLVGPLAPHVAPGVQVVHCKPSPYDSDFEDKLGELDSLVKTCLEFHPDCLVVAPYQRTRLDEYLMEKLPEVDSIGLGGRLYRGDFNAGLDCSSSCQFTTEVAVNESEPELRKNELLCSAILGRSVTLPPPAIRATEVDKQRAHTILAQNGLEPRNYWVACVGHNRWTAVRNWKLQDWGTALNSIPEEHHTSLLFLGTPDECEVTEEVRRHMGATADRTANLCDTRHSLATVVGLIAESAGYVGRDTGPMHLAAALGKPVVAVFGGGTWPRFVPAAPAGAAMTLEVPCSGCDWTCHLSDSHCVKGVPVHEVVSQIRRTFLGDGGFQVRARALTSEILHQLARDASVTAERRTRAANATIRELTERARHLEECLSAEHEAVNEQRNRTRLLQRQVDDLSGLAGRSKETLVEREFQLGNLRQDSEARREESDRLSDLLGLLKNEHSKLGEESTALKAKLTEVRADLEKLAQDHREIQALHADANARIDSIRQSVFTKILIKLGLWRGLE